MTDLLQQHQQLIAGSAISTEVAVARGYRSVTALNELARLGFSPAQRRVPALLIPIWTVDGRIGLYQVRPDSPRLKKGRPLKYETPFGAHLVLDIPPSVRAQLDDPSVPLWVTEGSRKADAAASKGLTCIALLGVWAWRGKNPKGGKTVLPEWESIALNGRDTFIAFDSDVMTKLEVHEALARLRAFLASRGAKVHFVYLPTGPGGAKSGLDDYLAAGHGVAELLALSSDELRPCKNQEPPRVASASSPNVARDEADAFDAFDASASLPQFPLEVLPVRFQDLAREFAATVDGVPDLVVPAMLCALATALGPGWMVGVQSLIRPPLLWLALVASSGASKTPAVKPVLAPLHDEDRRLRDVHRAEIQSYQVSLRAWNRAKDDDSLEKPPKPRRARATLTDITPEGIVAKLAASPRGLMVHSDELSQLLRSFDTYHSRPGRGRATFLSLWSGTRVAEGRKEADESEVDDPFVVLFGGIQPSVISSLALSDGDGLCGRFQWALPRCTAGGLGKCLGAGDQVMWRRAIQLALSHSVTSIQNSTPEGAALLDCNLRLWKQQAMDLEEARSGLLASMYGKAGDHCVRLAAVLHGMDEINRALNEHAAVLTPLQPRIVPTTTIERAIRLVEYYLAHGSVVARLVVARPEHGDALRAADRALVAHLRALVAPGQDITDTPARWAERLSARGCRLSEMTLGRTFVRLEGARMQGLVVERGVRGADRLWRVYRPPQASKATEASNSPNDAASSARIDERPARLSDESVVGAVPQSSHSPIDPPANSGRGEAVGTHPVAFAALVASTVPVATALIQAQAVSSALAARHRTADVGASDVCCQATDRGPAP